MEPGDRTALMRVGWREWVGLPGLTWRDIKAKVDTGAKTSALHADQFREIEGTDPLRIRFRVHPRQRDGSFTVEADAELVEYRMVTSSGGHRTHRPVIRTPLRMGTQTWEIELTLVPRPTMEFRMLLGREALRGRVLVDPSGSFLLGRHFPRRASPPKPKRRSPRRAGEGDQGPTRPSRPEDDRE